MHGIPSFARDCPLLKQLNSVNKINNLAQLGLLHARFCGASTNQFLKIKIWG
jgi:hypothetical protein